LPWARWWQTDESQMTAVQEMLRLGQNDVVLPGLAS